jgi:dCMP deaminase
MKIAQLEPRSTWDTRFLCLAQHIASWSKDDSTKVGSVIVRPDRSIASVGYNGFPRGVLDLPERYADREQKYPRVVHAEQNAILASHTSVRGFNLYVSPLPPCARCAGAIIQAGIARVVTDCKMADVPDRWMADIEIAISMFAEASVLFEAQ